MADVNKALVAAIGMMATDQDGEAQMAFGHATRLLQKAGLTWRDVARLVESRPQAAPANDVGSAFSSAFGDIFSGMRPQAARQPEPPRPPRPSRLAGAEIPAQIVGIATIDDERTLKGGEPMVFVTITNDHQVCGPMVAFSRSVIEQLRQSADEKRPVMVRVRQPASQGHSPCITGAAVTGAA